MLLFPGGWCREALQKALPVCRLDCKVGDTCWHSTPLVPQPELLHLPRQCVSPIPGVSMTVQHSDRSLDHLPEPTPVEMRISSSYVVSGWTSNVPVSLERFQDRQRHGPGSFALGLPFAHESLLLGRSLSGVIL